MTFEAAHSGPDPSTERKLLNNEIKHALLSNKLFKVRDKEFIAGLKQEAKANPQAARKKLDKCLNAQKDFMKLKNAYITSDETGSIFQRNVWDVSAEELIGRADEFAKMSNNLQRLSKAFSAQQIDGQTFGDLRDQLVKGNDLEQYEENFALAMDEYKEGVFKQEQQRKDDLDEDMDIELASL